ncbi:MAG: ABC transporter permease [Clostridium sp.]|nr:ABC transporter permease [Clostridium sp.]MCM1546933.1 ABC transporter permease [Ruminococcus sp.]
MDKVHRSRIMAFIYAVLFIFFVKLNLSLYQRINNAFPDAMEYILMDNSDEKNNTISVADVENARSNNENLILNAQVRETGIVGSCQNSLISENVNIIYTDNYYLPIHKLNIIKGEFFGLDMLSEHNAVIISDKLANLLFKSIDIIGNEIYLSGQKKSILGVYSEKDDIINKLSSNGSDTVFVPINLLEDTAKTDFLYIKSNSQSDNDIIYDTNELLDGKLSAFYYETNLYSIKRLLMNFFYILIDLSVICIVIQVCRIFLKKVSSVFLSIKVSLKDNSEVKTKKLVLNIFLLIFMLLTVFLIFKFGIADIYIPEGFLPVKEQLFDIGYYYDRFIKYIQDIQFTEIWNHYQSMVVVLLFIVPLITACNFFVFIKLIFLCMNQVKKVL